MATTSFTIDNSSGDYDGLTLVDDGGDLNFTFSDTNYDSSTQLQLATSGGTLSYNHLSDVNFASTTEILYTVEDPLNPGNYFAVVVVIDNITDVTPEITAVQIANLNNNAPNSVDAESAASFGEYLENTVDNEDDNALIDLDDIDGGDDFNIASGGGHGGGGHGGVPCLTETCNILTPNGYQNVSSLNVGDIVTTSDNRNVAIKEIFTSKVLTSQITPRVIRAHQYGKNQPMIDTHLSDWHAYQVNGIWKLPKNENLPQEWNNNVVTYYHVKLPNYTQDFLVVNGITMEGWDGLTPEEIRPYMWVKHGKGVVLKKL